MKEEIYRADGLTTIQDVLEAHIDHAGCMEHAIGLLAAVTLRYPEASASAIEAGLPATILRVQSSIAYASHLKA